MIPLTLDEIIRETRGKPCRTLSPITVTGVSTDSRTCKPGDVFFAIRGERFDGHDFVAGALKAGAVAAFVDQPIGSDESPLVHVSDTIVALGELAAFHRRQQSLTVVAVTGSNGKTTVKSMIDHVLSRHLTGRASPQSFNNAIGVPLTLLSARAGDDYLVAEIGSNAPGEIAALGKMVAPGVAVITSIGEAHLSGLGDLGGAAVEKLSLLEHVRTGGIAVINADAMELCGLAIPRGNFTVITFGISKSADIRVNDIQGDIDSTSFTINDKFAATIRLPGKHNAINAAAAFAVCRRLKLEPEEILEALESFEPPPMRLNVSRAGRMRIIDDSYNANPSSTAAAIDVLKNCDSRRRVFVAGEMLELGDQAVALHESTGRRIAEANIDMLVAVGRHGRDTINGAMASSGSLQTILYTDTEAACRELPGRLDGSETVLIKGSRRLGLDRLADRIRETFA